MNIAGLARRYFPILIWGAQYSQRTFAADLIDTIILISQSPAHELLGGAAAAGRTVHLNGRCFRKGVKPWLIQS